MSVSQYSVSKRFAALLAFVVLALFVLCTASRASAESTACNQRQVNVCLFYGTSLITKNYINTVQIYEGGKFTTISSSQYGKLSVKAGTVYLKLAKGETKVQIVTSYSGANGELVSFAWSGKDGLPVRRSYLGSEATLVSVNVGVHSPKLPNQSKQPKHTSMH